MHKGYLDMVLQWISQPWVGAFVGILGIIIGLFIAILFYFKSKKRAIPKAKFYRNTVISQRKDEIIDDVEILYKGNRINALYRTSIIFWNDGNDVLKSTDIVEDDPLVFSFEEDSILLRYEVIKNTRPVNKAKLSSFGDSQSAVKLEFEFFDQNDGVHIELLHTSESDPEIKGTIMGLKEGVKISNRNSKKTVTLPKILIDKIISLEKRIPVMYFSFFTFISIGGTWKLLEGFDNTNFFEIGTMRIESSFVVMSYVCTLLLGFGLWVNRRRYPKALMKQIF